MPPLMGNGEGCTVAIFTDAESRFMREATDELAACGDNRAALICARAVARGTAKLAEEFKAEQQRRKGMKK